MLTVSEGNGWLGFFPALLASPEDGEVRGNFPGLLATRGISTRQGSEHPFSVRVAWVNAYIRYLYIYYNCVTRLRGLN